MSQYDVTVLDYGLGNLGSIMNMFRRIGINANLANTPDLLKSSKRILLPGVGAFDTGMHYLNDRGFTAALHEKKQSGTPILGICLGMQLLTDNSEEGQASGLGWIKANTVNMKRIADNPSEKFPHVGWNFIDQAYDHHLCKNLPEDPRFYFVHSYMVQCNNQNDVVASTTYANMDVTAIISHENIAGAQFHPEKSHKFGMGLLQNFATWSP